MIIGRPPGYSNELADRICEAVANSQSGLRKTLESDPEFPALASVRDWLKKHAYFSQAFAHAKRQQLEAMAEDIVDHAMDERLDPNERRLIVDTKKWLLSKLLPKTYGDKLDLTSSGEALAVPSHQIDARIQSIIMQAQMRQRGQLADLSRLPQEAQSLLE